MTMTELINNKTQKVKEASERCSSKGKGHAEDVIMVDATYNVAITKTKGAWDGYSLYCMEKSEGKLVLVRTFYEREKAVAAYIALTS